MMKNTEDRPSCTIYSPPLGGLFLFEYVLRKRFLKYFAFFLSFTRIVRNFLLKYRKILLKYVQKHH